MSAPSPEPDPLPRLHPEIFPSERTRELPPAQINLFTGEPEAVVIPIETEPPDGEERIIDEGIRMVKTGDTSQVVLSGFGMFLSKKSERLLVRQGKTVVYEFPMFRLSEVVVASRGVTLSSDVVEELCQRGIRLSFLTNGGKPYAMLSSPMLTATVVSRREQLAAIEDARGVEFAKSIVGGKLTNQGRLLRYFGKYLKQADPERFERVDRLADQINGLKPAIQQIAGPRIDDVRGSLMGYEGTGGRLYWDGVKEIIGQRGEFMGREYRGATDAVNSLLNYGYGILYSQVWGAVLNAGLEPFAGFLHVDRPGKPSLVLDLVEEFRQPVVDRTVIAHINLGEAVTLKAGMLDEETRSRYAAKILERLESTETVKGKKYQIKSIIQMQARSLCTFLRREGDYKPFGFKW
ncbi:MAG: CRISPR-associated protein Cas1 [Nitrospira sp.]|jgi:CRISPR-associated protein Cas1|nr:CRISPR-associated protein Cas1 [Nitrospira sp.]